MQRFPFRLALGSILTAIVTGCGGGSGADTGGTLPPPPSSLTSYLGTTGQFVAALDPSSSTFQVAQTGTYAGKRQSLRGTVDFLTGAPLGQPAGIEIYKADDGHIYALDLASSGPPAAVQVSSESSATIDDACSLSGTQVPGANYDYVGVYFTADLETPTNSSYFYRLPGPDGVCDTEDDQFQMVKTGMSADEAPIAVVAMPVATVRTSAGGISGFVIKNDADLVLVDNNFGNPVTLATFSAPINVAVALPVGTSSGYPTGQLFVIDGSIYFVDYAGQSVSAALYSIPNWTSTTPAALYAASPSNLFFAINTPATGGTPAAASIYSLPADGSAAPTLLDSEAGRVTSLQFPVQGSNLIWGVVNATYAIREIPVAGGNPGTLVTSTLNAGSFIATANSVYYETWMGSNDSATLTVSRSGTQSGIVNVDGTVVQAPLANSIFANGGEQSPFAPDDTTTTATPLVTVFQLSGLSPISVVDPSSGYQYTEDGIGGATLTSIDTTSNQVVATLGIVPPGMATELTGTYRSAEHSGFLEAIGPLSTLDPASRDLYLVNSQMANSLQRIVQDL